MRDETVEYGKNVISDTREGRLKFICERMRRTLPVINESPATIGGVLRECLLTPRRELVKVEKWSWKYVERWHNSLKIAAMLKTKYEAIVACKKP